MSSPDLSSSQPLASGLSTYSLVASSASQLEFDQMGTTTTVVRRVNRFGTLTKKGRSHAQLLGYQPTNYVPRDKLADLALKVSQGGTASQGSSIGRVDTKDLKDLLAEDPQSDLIQVEVQHLKEAGLNLDEITRYVYEHLHDQALPNFMTNLRLDEDGGLDRVHTLWYNQRVFWAVLLFGFVGMNVWYLVSSNWLVFQSVTTHILKTDSRGVELELGSGEELARNTGGEISDIYSHIKDGHKRELILHLAGIVGTFEVLWVVAKLLHCVDQFRVFMCSQSEYKQWKEVTGLFQESLPVLSTFSLLKFVSFVHPSLIAAQYFDVLQQRYILPDSVLGTVIVTLYFITTRLMIAVLAVGAFAMKLLSVGLKLMDTRYGLLECFVQSALLMNQVIGCVLFERVLQDRIFLFIFGGSDTDFREDELALKGVYRCRLSKQIWEEFYTKQPVGQRWKAIIMLATLDHFDLQMLLINDPPESNLTASRCDGEWSTVSGRS